MKTELQKPASRKRSKAPAEPLPTTREKILDAALRRFSEKGYLGATTREIAQEAGVAEVTLFRHFSSKEALFEAVLSTHTFLPALKEIIPSIQEKPIEEALIMIAQKYLLTLDRRRDFIKIMLTQSHFFPEKVHTIYHAFLAEIFTTLATYFRNMQKAGVLRAFDPMLGARAFLAMFFTYFLTNDIIQFQANERTSTDAVIREYIGYFMVGTLQQDGKAE